jgi:butyryl-CoA dehydrogenase
LTGLLRADPDLALANASIYLDAFGRVTLAWIWLQQGRAATLVLRPENGGTCADYYRGKLQAMRYFFQWELPQTQAQWALLARCERTAYDMRNGWFA